MCSRCCSLISFQVASFIISVICMTLSFIFGPLYTIMYFTSQTPIKDLIKKESQFTTLLFSIIAVMWIIFFASCFLLFGSRYRNIILVNLFLVLTALQMSLAFAVATGYMFYCCFMDNYCFDHTPNRWGDDIGASVGLFFSTLLFDFLWLAGMFVACNFKIALKRKRRRKKGDMEAD